MLSFDAEDLPEFGLLESFKHFQVLSIQGSDLTSIEQDGDGNGTEHKFCSERESIVVKI